MEKNVLSSHYNNSLHIIHRDIWAPSSEFVSSSIPSWQILTAHAQPFRGARDLAFCLKVPLDSLLVWASSGGSGETARMRRLAWTFAARICDKYQIRLARPICWSVINVNQNNIIIILITGVYVESMSVYSLIKRELKKVFHLNLVRNKCWYVFTFPGGFSI